MDRRRPLFLHGAEEDIFLSDAQGLFHIGLIEEGQMQNSGVIHYFDLNQLQASANSGQAGPLGHHGDDTDPPIQRGLPDAVETAAVLIISGIVMQQIGGGGQAQLFQLFGPNLSHTGKLGDGSVE